MGVHVRRNMQLDAYNALRRIGLRLNSWKKKPFSLSSPRPQYLLADYIHPKSVYHNMRDRQIP